jgi:hypothetical protein
MAQLCSPGMCIAVMGLSLWAGTPAQAWQLITEEEFAREASAPHAGAAAPVIPSDAPVITLDQPDATNPIKSPVSIRVSFHPKEGSTIDINSLRVTYGFFAIDITQRILANAQRVYVRPFC